MPPFVGHILQKQPPNLVIQCEPDDHHDQLRREIRGGLEQNPPCPPELSLSNSNINLNVTCLLSMITAPYVLFDCPLLIREQLQKTKKKCTQFVLFLRFVWAISHAFYPCFHVKGNKTKQNNRRNKSARHLIFICSDLKLQVYMEKFKRKVVQKQQETEQKFEYKYIYKYINIYINWWIYCKLFLFLLCFPLYIGLHIL